MKKKEELEHKYLPLELIMSVLTFYSASTNCKSCKTMGVHISYHIIRWSLVWTKMASTLSEDMIEYIRHWIPCHLPSRAQLEVDHFHFQTQSHSPKECSKGCFQISIPVVQSGSTDSTRHLSETNWRCLCFFLSYPASNYTVGHWFLFAAPNVKLPETKINHRVKSEA